MASAVALAGHPLNYLNDECGVILSFSDDYSIQRIIKLIPPIPEAEADILAEKIKAGESLESLGIVEEPRYGDLTVNPDVHYFQMRK